MIPPHIFLLRSPWPKLKKSKSLRQEYTVFSDLQSGEVDASGQKSEPVCRFELTDLIENHIVYDGQRLQSFVYDGQFFLCDYYKVGKCMMPIHLKSEQILKVM